MGEYFFGLGKGHLPKWADKIARKHGARLTNYVEPNGEERHWFSCRNRGLPFDQSVKTAVMAEIEKRMRRSDKAK